MLKTEAICIKNTRFGESSVVSKMFTVDSGLNSFMIQGLNRKKNAIQPSHILPGNLLEMVVYNRSYGSVQRVKEIRITHPLTEIHTNMVKSAILQFMLEIVVKSNEEDFRDPVVFEFLKRCILELESQSDNLSGFPLLFLCKNLRHSGWFPNVEVFKPGYIFDLNEGKFESFENISGHVKLSIEESLDLYNILKLVQENLKVPQESLVHRKALFSSLLYYYQIHLLKGKPIKSPVILAEILG